MIDTEYHLGETFYNTQEYEKAIEYYNVCLNILNDNFDINDDQELNIKDKIKKLKELTKNKIALSYANLGDIYFNKKKYIESINNYEKYIEIEKNKS